MQGEDQSRESAAVLSPSPAKPLLILHVGPHKTGSSTLQHWLADNAGRLAERGILYPAVDHNFGPQAFIGNAHSIAIQLRAEAPADLAGLLEQETARYEALAEENDGRAVILSSEFLALARPENLDMFKEVAQRRFDLRAVGAIRDPYWWLWSCWGQAIKRGGVSQTFRPYALYSKTFNYDLLCKFADIFEDFRLIAYSEHRLFEDFSLATGLDFSELQNEILPTVNRSLTKEEMELLLLVNRVFADPKLSTAISNGMLLHAPDAAAYRHYDRETAHIVREANAEMLAALRRLIVNPEVPVLDEVDGPEDVFEIQTAVNADLLRRALMSMRFMPARRMDYALRRLQKMARDPLQAERPAELPSDFDAIHYLLLNEDVLLSDRDPFDHYLTNGHAEGRLYRARAPKTTANLLNRFLR